MVLGGAWRVTRASSHRHRPPRSPSTSRGRHSKPKLAKSETPGGASTLRRPWKTSERQISEAAEELSPRSRGRALLPLPPLGPAVTAPKGRAEGQAGGQASAQADQGGQRSRRRWRQVAGRTAPRAPASVGNVPRPVAGQRRSPQRIPRLPAFAFPAHAEDGLLDRRAAEHWLGQRRACHRQPALWTGDLADFVRLRTDGHAAGVCPCRGHARAGAASSGALPSWSEGPTR